MCASLQIQVRMRTDTYEIPAIHLPRPTGQNKREHPNYETGVVSDAEAYPRLDDSRIGQEKSFAGDMAKSKDSVPELQSTSPMRLVCTTCRAKPGDDCVTSSGGLSVVHLSRIRAAALIDRTNDIQRRRPKISGSLVTFMALCREGVEQDCQRCVSNASSGGAPVEPIARAWDEREDDPCLR